MIIFTFCICSRLVTMSQTCYQKLPTTSTYPDDFPRRFYANTCDPSGFPGSTLDPSNDSTTGVLTNAFLNFILIRVFLRYPKLYLFNLFQLCTSLKMLLLFSFCSFFYFSVCPWRHARSRNPSLGDLTRGFYRET